LITACGIVDDGEGGSANSVSHGSGGAAGATGTTAQSGNFAIAGATGFTMSTGGTGCTLDADAGTLFSDEQFSRAQPWPLVFYSWTTAEQVAELRANSVLFSRSERTGLGRGLVFDTLANLATNRQDDTGKLAKLLGEQLFITARFGWTNHWATRMGWSGEQYGDQLIRIELKPEAWIVEFDGVNFSVTDVNHQYVPPEQIFATPERIGAIYFLRGSSAGGPSCGTFCCSGGNGFREFVLGNLAMVKQWSLGTQDIQQKLGDDIAKLKILLSLLQACPPAPYSDTWNAEVVCNWYYSYGGMLSGYLQSLSLPSEYYYPTPDTLTTLINTLESDPFTVDPFVVNVSP
jgi:hypothetical protein